MAEGAGNTLAASIAETVRNAIEQATPAAIAGAIQAVRAGDLARLYHPRLIADVSASAIATGLPASPGAASGRIALTTDEAFDASARGEQVILVRSETTPDDVAAMQVSTGILTTRGGMTSHAAVVARGLGIPAVVGADAVRVEGALVRVGDAVLHAGDQITIDGSNGNVFSGRREALETEVPAELGTLLSWADAAADGRVVVRANADTMGDAIRARGLGARGIGLCRTEHMFLAADRLPMMRRFILAHDAVTEASALGELESVQTTDFQALLEAMSPHPVTVRLLDPPLHEFLPDLIALTIRKERGELDDREHAELAAAHNLRETNPMLGSRGVRLGFLRTGLNQMQVRALCRAAANVIELGGQPRIEIMIPLIIDAEEVRIARTWVHDVLAEIGHPELTAASIRIGAMIETPRGALVAGEVAAHADFLSFGTNDLTQMTYAFSRDDVESKLLPAYVEHKILTANPFAELDRVGVGALIRIACESARATKADIALSVCGEHGGDPSSIEFLVGLGLDSVSCSPYRVPVARLAVAQALLTGGRVAVGDIGVTTSGQPPAPADVGAALVDIDEVVVVHILRVRGFVSPDGFIESIGVFPEDILVGLVEAGHVRHIETRNIYGLLKTGRALHESLLVSYAPDFLIVELRPSYEQFLALNDEFKALCRDWQLHDGSPNDHRDAEHDARCIDRLATLVERAQPILQELATTVPRMARYANRLAAALSKVRTGDIDRFTGVACNSVHDIWMELHEDLIVLQRIDRVSEGSY